MSANQFTLANANNGVPSQVILNAGLNVFALQLLIENFTAANGERTGPVEMTVNRVRVSLAVAEPPADVGRQEPDQLTQQDFARNRFDILYLGPLIESFRSAVELWAQIGRDDRKVDFRYLGCQVVLEIIDQVEPEES